MFILSVSTSSNICSVAILEDDKCICELNLDNGKTHSENLMPLIQKAINQANINTSDVNLIACDVGPGSFTGIRIGISSIKAIAEANNIPIVSVTSLEGLSYFSNEDCLCSLIDARNNQVYCGIFNNSHKLLQNYIADDINNVIKELKKYNNITCIGDGAILHKDLLQSTLNCSFTESNCLSALNIGLCAFKKFNQGIVETADSITPFYLRKSQAERLRRE